MTDVQSSRLAGLAPTDLSFLRAAVESSDADGFVHVGDRFDADFRYLSRVSGVDRECAFVYAHGRAVLCVPESAREQVEASFLRDPECGADGIDTEVDADVAADADPIGVRAAEALADLGAGGSVLAPRHLPHDAAVYIERAGYEVASTTAVTDARAVKTGAELDRLERVQAAAVRGAERAETILAESTLDGGRLVWAGDLLTVGRLRRAVNEALVAGGVRPAENTAIVVAGSDGRPPDVVVPGQPIAVDLSPREPNGYHGALARTYVVAGEGGWERRASVAVEAARRAGLAALADGDGTPASAVATEIRAELRAYGFTAGGGTDSRAVGRTIPRDVIHGVGLSRFEDPSLARGGDLVAGNVVAIAPTVADPGHGLVRVTDLAVVREDGFELLAESPTGLVPDAT